MANLFNKKILQQKIKDFSIPDIESKLTQVKNWQRNLASIKGINEKRLQSKFLQSFFEDILGYDNSLEKDEWTLDIEVSSDVDAKTPDGVLGFYSRDDDGKEIKSHHAVIELKGPQVSLDKDQRRGGTTYKSPVDQAFSYIQRLDKCKWIIVSNFIEIRLYQVGRSKEYFETFYLRDLDDIDEFKRFYYILSQENLIARNEDSNTYKLTQATQKRDEDISNEFYTLYSQTRVDLFEHILENNIETEAEIALEKSQKFLDRIIFICFCEDKNLLPNDLLHNAIEQGKNSFLSDENQVWPQIKGVFKAIDKGYPDRNINAFNGGLFEDDIVLDCLIIKDDFFEIIYRISDYDFDSDVDVNILGHIFEQSISDIEKLKSDIQDNQYDKSLSRRKKEGIYYTPRYITSYIVEEAVGGCLEDIKKELGYYDLPNIEDAGNQSWKTQYSNQHLEFYKKYEDRLKDIKILDPACGSGAFLNQAFEYLLNEHKWINDQRDLIAGVKSIFAVDSAQRNILKNNLYGVDLNEESVEITKLSLWLKTANKRKPLTNLDDNIKCGNSLIDDFVIAGGKAFVWEDEFKGIMDRGGFDVVIGNPPYIDSEEMTRSIPRERDFYSNSFKTAKGNWDIFVVFVEQAYNLTKREGYISYIVPNKIIGANYTKDLRKMMSKYQVIKLNDYSKVKVFPGADVYPLIFVSKKTENKKQESKIEIVEQVLDSDFANYFYVTPDLFYEDIYWGKFFNSSYKKLNIIEKMSSYKRLGDLAEILGAATVSEAYEVKKYIESNENFEVEGFLKFINTGTIDRYESLWGISKTQYIKDQYLYPIVKKDELKKMNIKRLNQSIKSKVIIAGMTKRLECFYDEGNYLAGKSTTILLSKGLDLIFITALLNSKLLTFYYDIFFSSLKMSGGYFNIGPEQLKRLPINIVNNLLSHNITELAKEIIKYKRELQIKNCINFNTIKSTYTSKMFNSFEEIINNSSFNNIIYSGRASVLRTLTIDINSEIITIYTDKSSSGKYEILKFEEDNEYKRRYIKYYLENLSEDVLENLNELDGNILEKTLQIGIPDYDKDHVVRKVVTEWENLQKEISQLEEAIEKTDKEIDQLVYELYGLTEEEIEVVEESI